MVGLGRQQKCSGAQNSLQQLVKERLRGLVESWMGEGNLDPPEIGSTSQQEEGACEYGWSAALLAHNSSLSDSAVGCCSAHLPGLLGFEAFARDGESPFHPAGLFHIPSLLMIACSCPLAHYGSAEAP